MAARGTAAHAEVGRSVAETTNLAVQGLCSLWEAASSNGGQLVEGRAVDAPLAHACKAQPCCATEDFSAGSLYLAFSTARAPAARGAEIARIVGVALLGATHGVLALYVAALLELAFCVALAPDAQGAEK